jgi:hypothetical protein
MQTHRQIAKRKTILWQVTAVAILAAAGAAIALPMVDKLFAPDEGKKIALAPAPPKPAPPNYSDLKFAEAMNGARGTANPVAPPTPPPPPPEGEGIAGKDTPPPPPPPSPTEWAYIGSIITSSHRNALVKVDGQQQIFSVGATHNNSKLVAIEKDHIEVETGGVKQSIKLAERTMLAPAEGPKRPVAFRSAPNLPPTPGGAGGTMVMNPASRPGPLGPGAANAAPGTMEQARAAAMAAAEAAMRNKAAMDVPGIVPLEKIDAEEMQVAAKYLSDPSLDDGARMKYLNSLGITPGTPVDAAIGRAKEAGIDLSSESGKHIINAIEFNAKNKGSK